MRTGRAHVNIAIRKGRPLKRLLILSERSRYVLIAVAIIALAGSSKRSTLQATQKETVQETPGTPDQDDQKAVQEFLRAVPSSLQVRT